MRLAGALQGPSSARRIALAAASIVATAAALVGGEIGGAALRALALLASLGLAGAWLRLRHRRPETDPLMTVEARQPLSREAGLVLVRIEARRLLVGYGPTGASLLVELGGEEPSP